MSIAADPRYRNIRLEWLNNSYKGNEVVQLFAQISAGVWSIVGSYAINGDDQLVSWATALPVAAYSIALRYMNGATPTAGFEGTDPDFWTSPFAPGTKTSLITGCATPVWGAAPPFVNAGSPVTLAWANAQQGVPYLLEKSVDGGATYTTIASSLVANIYAYSIPPAEVGTTVRFRLTARRDLTIGPTAGVLLVPMLVTVGQPAWVSANFVPSTAIASLQWTTAANATGYLLEKTIDGGASWLTIATPAGTSYDYNVPDAEINTTVGFRVRGTSASGNGIPSITQNVAMTVIIGATVLSAGAFDGRTGHLPFTFTAATNANQYFLQKSTDGGATWLPAGASSGGAAIYTISAAEVNTTMQFRLVPAYRSVLGAPSNVVIKTMTVSVGTPPSSIVVTGYSATGGNYGLGYATLTWTPSTSTDINYVSPVDSAGSSFGDATFGPTDSGSGRISKYSSPQASVKIRVQIAGNAILQESGFTSLSWP
jgi:hypothetical protein